MKSLRIILLSLTLAVLYFHPSKVVARGDCSFDFSAAGADRIFQYPTEQVVVGANSILLNGEPVTTNQAGQFYLLVTKSGTFSSRYDLDAGAISNGLLGPTNISQTVMSLTQAGSGHSIGLYTTIGGARQICEEPLGLQISYQCSIAVTPSKTSDNLVNVAVTLGGAVPPGNYRAVFRLENQAGDAAIVSLTPQGDGVYTNGFQGNLADGIYTLVVTNSANPVLDITDLRALQPSNISNCLTSFTINKAGLGIDNTPEDSFPKPPVITDPASFSLCSQTNAADRDACLACTVNDSTSGKPAGFWTAFGCVETTKEGIVTSMIRIGMGLSGGFVLLSILYGAFLLTTSSGDPKRVQEGQEMISSAIMGLLFVIFSVIILQFIGVSILRIPGFGT